jgi:hypothetical protein
VAVLLNLADLLSWCFQYRGLDYQRAGSLFDFGYDAHRSIERHNVRSLRRFESASGLDRARFRTDIIKP